MKTLSEEGSGDALGAQRKQELVRCLGLVFSDLFSTVVPLLCPPCPCPSRAHRAHTLGLHRWWWPFLLISPRLPLPAPVSSNTVIRVSPVCAGPSLLYIISFFLRNYDMKGITPAFQVKKMRNDMLRCTVRE